MSEGENICHTNSLRFDRRVSEGENIRHMNSLRFDRRVLFDIVVGVAVFCKDEEYQRYTLIHRLAEIGKS